MLQVCWSPKGGSGTSVVAAAIALQAAAEGHDTLLVDLAGDQAAVCGVEAGDGIGDWFAAAADVGPKRVTLEVSFAVADQLLNLLAEEAGMAWAPEDYAATTPAPKAIAKPDLTSATTVKELRRIAKEYGIAGAAKMNKADLIDALA
jgi:hypothetical protein